MLNYDTMLRFVEDIDAQDLDAITFTLVVKDPDIDELHKTPCKFVRRINGWTVRAELIVDGYCYHSESIQPLIRSELITLHTALMSRYSTRRSDAEQENVAWVDTLQDLMSRKVKELDSMHN